MDGQTSSCYWNRACETVPLLVLVLAQNYRTQFLQRDQTLSVPFATEGKAGETSGAPKVSKDMDSSLGALPQAVMMWGKTKAKKNMNSFTTYSLYLNNSFPNGWMFYLYIFLTIYNRWKDKMNRWQMQLFPQKLVKAPWVDWKTDQTCVCFLNIVCRHDPVYLVIFGIRNLQMKCTVYQHCNHILNILFAEKSQTISSNTWKKEMNEN